MYSCLVRALIPCALQTQPRSFYPLIHSFTFVFLMDSFFSSFNSELDEFTSLNNPQLHLQPTLSPGSPSFFENTDVGDMVGEWMEKNPGPMLTAISPMRPSQRRGRDGDDVPAHPPRPNPAAMMQAANQVATSYGLSQGDKEELADFAKVNFIGIRCSLTALTCHSLTCSSNSSTSERVSSNSHHPSRLKTSNKLRSNIGSK